MANNINIPFEMQLVALKNFNETISKQTEVAANHMASTLTKKLQSVVDKSGEVKLDFGQATTDLENIGKGFRGILRTVNQIDKLLGRNTLTTSLSSSFTEATKTGQVTLKRLEKLSDIFFRGLVSNSELTRAKVSKSLSRLFNRADFQGDDNQARQQFLQLLEKKLSDYKRGVERTGRDLQKKPEQSELEGGRKLRKEALSFVSQELALNKELLKEKKALRAAGVLDDSEINTTRSKINILRGQKFDLETTRITKDTNLKPLQDIVTTGQANVNNVTQELDASVKSLQTKKEQVAQTKRLEKATERVVAQQERLRNLLLQTLQLRGNLSGKDRGFDAIQSFVNADPRQVAEDRVNKKSGVLTPEQLKIAADGVKQVNAQARAHQHNALSIENFGKASVLAFKRYGAFLTGTFLIYKIQQGFQLATDEALKFEAAMTKVEQVAVKNVKEIGNISNAIRSAAINTGTSSSEIANIVQIFGQAGFKDAKELAKIADSLSKIPLAATFGDLKSTSEGLIAIFGQFNKTLSDTPQILDLVNQFAADFAVESGDIFEGVKRGGAIFAEAGGSLEEFVALFSLLRSATRQSAETIGTFFKSGIAELLSDRAQKQIKILGVEAEGAIPQLQELSKILFAPDFKGNAIKETSELIGNRQVGLLVALLRELEQSRIKALQSGGVNDVTKALKNASGSLDRDIIVRLDDVGTSLNRVKQALSDLAVEFIQNNGVKSFVKDMADLTVQLTKGLKLLVAFIPAASAFAAAISIPRFINGARNFTSGVSSGAAGASGAANLAVGVAAGLSGGVANSESKQQQRTRLVSGLGVAGLIGAGQFLSSNFRNEDGSSKIIAGKFSANNLGTTANIAGLGALLGSAILPGIGTAVGTVVGAAVGLGVALRENTKALRKQEILDSTPEQLIADLITNATKISNINSISNAAFNSGGNFVVPLGNLQRLNIPKTVSFADRDKKVTSDILNDNDLLNKFAPELNNIRSQGIKLTQKEFITRGILPSLEDFQTIFQFTVEQLLRDSNIFGNIDPTILFQTLPNFKLDNKSLSRLIDSTVAIFDNFVERFSKVFNDFVVAIKSNDLNTINIKDRLGAISTNLEESLKTFLPTNDSDLLKFVGIDTGFDSLNLGKSLQSFFNKPDARAALSRLSEPKEVGDEQPFDLNGVGSFNAIADFLFFRNQDPKLLEQFSKQFKGIFETLAEINGVPIGEIFKTIFTGDNLFDGADKAQEKLKNIEKQAADAFRKRNEIIQQQIELENALAKSSRDANQALFQLNNEIAKNVTESRSRNIENDLSLNSTQAATLRTNLFKQVASTSSFGNTAQFIQSYLDANRRRIDLQQTLTSSRTQFVNNESLLKDSNKADQTFQDRQQELNQRITEFDTRISAAAQTTDLLKQAFLSLRDNIRSAGQSITSLTTKDFGSIVGTLRSFVSGGGLENPFGPLSKFSSSQFSQLQQGLGLVGNINLGNGQTGTSILEGIQDQLGVSVIAGIKSLFTGQDETANITKELQESRKKAEEAAKLEDALRKEQLELLRAQAGIIPTTAKFYEDQLTLLGKIDTDLGQLNAIRDSVVKLFTNNNIQNVSIAKSTGSTNSPLFGGSSSINNIPNLPPSVKSPFTPPSFFPSDKINPSFPYENDPRIPKSIRTPNYVLPKTVPEEIFDPSQLDSRGRPIRSPSVPNGFAPFAPLPRGTAPPINFSNDQFNEGVTNLVDAADGIKQTLEKLSESQKFTLEVAPMQINVALSAPDVLKLVGVELQSNITKQIALKLSEVFQTDPETSSKILASLGT